MMSLYTTTLLVFALNISVYASDISLYLDDKDSISTNKILTSWGVEGKSLEGFDEDLLANVKKADLGYKKIKLMKNNFYDQIVFGFDERPFVITINQNFLNVLESLACLGDLGFHKAQQRYFKLAQNIRENNLSLDIYKKILEKSADYRSQLISYHCQVICNNAPSKRRLKSETYLNLYGNDIKTHYYRLE